MVRDLSATATDVSHPLLKPHEVNRNNVLLVICSNRGLCGGYNTSILREANARIAQIEAEGATLHLELSGKRAINYYRYQRRSAEQTYTQFEDKPAFEQVKVIADRYIEGYVKGTIDRVDVAYMKFESSSRQRPVVETLLPLAALEQGAHAPAARPVDYEFLPNAQEILENLLPVTFRIRLFKCFLDAAVSEQIARRVTMAAATENADEIIKSLTSQYNRARQASITKEIAEVIGGAAALQ
jgi:F-type H+-transporting ATPase subunit gamma